MPSNYPTSLDSFTDPTSGSSLASPSHSGQHIDLNDAVEKIEAKLGIGSSPASSAANGSVLVANGSGSTSWSANASGLVKIIPTGATNGTVSADGTVTLGTGITSVTVNGAFSSLYDSYQIRLSGGASSGNFEIQMQLGATTTNYYTVLVFGTYTAGAVAATQVQVNNGSAWGWMGAGTTSSLNMMCDINNPFLADHTFYSSSWTQIDTAGRSQGYLANTTSYTDFKISIISGTMTGGSIRVYGFRN